MEDVAERKRNEVERKLEERKAAEMELNTGEWRDVCTLPVGMFLWWAVGYIIEIQFECISCFVLSFPVLYSPFVL